MKRCIRHRARWFAALCLSSGLALAQPTPWVQPTAAEVDAQFKQAMKDAFEGDAVSAAAFLRWYHEHGLRHAPGHGGVRLSFALAAWRALAQRHPPALEDLRDARDRAAAKVRAGGYALHEAMADLAALDQALGDPTVTRDTFVWLQARRPADARAFAQLALPALLAANEPALALPSIDEEELLGSMQGALVTFTDPRLSAALGDAQQRLNLAQSTLDSRAAPNVAVLVKAGERERAQALVTRLRAVLGPEAPLPATLAALRGEAPPFDRLGGPAGLQRLQPPPVWTPPAAPDMEALRKQARADEAAGRFAQAAAFHRWFHDEALRFAPSYGGVRRSFALSHWRELAEHYMPALLDMREARDRAAAKVRDGGPGAPSATRDLVALELHLADPSASLATALWLEQHRPADLPAFVKETLPALVAAGNPALAVRYLDDAAALQDIRRSYVGLTGATRGDEPPEARRRSALSFADAQAAPAVAALVQTGQAERAKALVAQLREVVGTDAKLPACGDALRGFAPPFRRP